MHMCAADHDCGVPLINQYVKLNYTSTLEGFILTLTCENNMILNMNTTDEDTFIVICHNNATSWIPNPANFIKSCSPFTTVPPGIILYCVIFVCQDRQEIMYINV